MSKNFNDEKFEKFRNRGKHNGEDWGNPHIDDKNRKKLRKEAKRRIRQAEREQSEDDEDDQF